ncbi:MAG: type III-B CRISPR module RAMP protein Cmr1 [Polyangiaceae bacterium]|nr:type III-B CRISPR module RAMP protein Cmr1 [Polyangiaceae bacterium]
MAITRLTATYRVTTPMFCAGADQQQAELRPASFKGALRFWFRAVAWATHGDIASVRSQEDALFGSTRTGQAKVLLSLAPLEERAHMPANRQVDIGLGYLAGQGLSKPNRDGALTTRPSLGPDTCFKVRLVLRSTSAAEQAQVRRALIALGLLGGLGARSRRGFGSLTLESLHGEGETDQVWTAPRDLAALKDQLSALLPPRSTIQVSTGSADPPYTAFSDGSRIVLVPTAGDTAEGLLRRVGMSLLHYRGYGRRVGNSHRVGAVPALQWFSHDHDEMLKAADKRNGQSAGTKLAAPHRAAFGLPHNYRFGSLATNVEVNSAVKERRASPVLLHVHRALEARPIAVVAFLPALFLPDARLRIVRRKKGEARTSFSATLPSSPGLWQPIQVFLDELLKGDQSGLCERFPGAVEVKP